MTPPLPLSTEPVMSEEHAPLVDGAAHEAERLIELFCARLADAAAGSIHFGLLHAAAQATAPKGE